MRAFYNSSEMPRASITTIADALDRAAASDRGIRFFSSRGDLEHDLSYRDLRVRAMEVARKLLSMGFYKGQRLGLIAETHPSFLTVFYACQYIGLVPCPLPMAGLPGGREAYLRRLAALSIAARLTAIVMPSGLRNYCDEIAELSGIDILTPERIDAIEPTGELVRPSSEDPAYIQYSSGSTADPKGILITQKAVCTNALSIVRNGLKLRDADRAFSWLPFYHDMGLVGFSIAPLFGLCSVDYLSPSAFARRPRLWLELMSDNGSTITYSPTFGYRLAAQRYGVGGKPIDLSRVRVAGIGGDAIDGDALDVFADATQDAGFRRSAFLPSYGMAEAVLAVTFADLDSQPTIEKPNGMTGRYVVCGRPLPELDLIVVDEQGHSVSECTIGHIWIRGPSVISSYFTNQDATEAIRRRDGFIDTGDLGYLTEGNIVVTGRCKDLIQIRGRNIWPQDVEWAVERLPSLKSGDVAAFGIEKNGEEQLIVLVQCALRDDEGREELRQRAVSVIGEAIGISARIELIGPRDLPFTSSGKLSRARAKSLFLQTVCAQNEQLPETTR